MTIQRFEKILLCLEQPEAPKEYELRRTVELAKRCGASVELFTVIEESMRVLRSLAPAFEHVDSLIEKERREALDAITTSLQGEGIDATAKLVRGRPHLQIIQEAIRGGHDLVIATAHHREDTGRFFGSTVLRLLRKCPCPVWVLGPASGDRYHRIVATIDLFPETDERTALNHKIMELSTSIAEFEGAELDVLHVWDVYGETLLAPRVSPAELQSCIDKARGRSKAALDAFLAAYPSVTTEHAILEKGDPGDVIPRFIEEHRTDLVVMGTVARTGIPGFIIGNTAETVIRQIRRSVLAVKPDGFESPVRSAG